ncbi:MAG TPA: Ig-like domain repeat protein [Blastocatellia bacterium]|nr:Ig-like domain repeat protein [Blastocatellia bacterium]
MTGSTSLNNCTISGNTATNGVNSAGGGVYFNAGYSATISGSDIFNNNAGQGGGVFNGGSDSTPTSTLTINSLTLIHGNSAVTSGSGKGNGGGIGNAEIGGGSNPATTNVTKTHIFGNSATSAGGGISVGGGTFTMSFSRIINNTSGASNSRGLENNSTTGIPTNVSDNWWGCSQNPTTASTPCDSAHTTTGTLTTTPFLQIKTTASQNPIATGSTATLTATVQDSTGANQSAANLDVFLATNATAGTPLPVIWSAVTNTVTTNANSSPLQNVGGFAKATATYNGTTPVHQDPTVAKVDNDFTTGTHPDIVLMTVLSPPSIAKSFGAPTVTVGGVTTLQFTITNPNTGDSLNGVAFTDTFPANIAVGPTPGVVNTCGGTFTAVAGAGSVSLSGGTVAANSSCTVSVNIQGTADGVANNTTGSVTATDAGGLTGNTASASIVVANPISITKGFGAATIPLNGTTSLTFTLTNSNSNTTLNGVAFTDNLPSGLVIATPGNPSTTCSGTFTAANGSSTASLSGATLAPGATCTATVTVQGTTSGVKNNTVTASSTTTGSVTSTGTATVTVVSPPTISKAFGASSIPLNGSTLLSFTITNPASNPVTLTGVGFTDNLPGGLVVSTPNGLSGGCGGGTITAAAGSSSISLSGASLTSGSSCTFSVNVTGVAAGNQINTTSQVTSNEGGNGGTATASIIVVAPPSIAKAFTPTTIAVNATTSLSFTITNPAANTVPLTGVAFTDVLPAGLTVPNSSASACGGTVTLTAPSTITLSGATIATNSQCVFSVTVTGASSGQFTNTTGNVTSTNGGTGNTASATVTVASPPTIAKVFGVASMPVNATTSLTFNIANPNSGIALTGVAFSDNLPAGLVVATPNGLTNTCSGSVTAAAGSGSISLNGGTIAASGSCTITVNVTGTTVGVKNNITGNVTSTETGPGGAATASITITARTTTTSVSFSSNPSVFGQTIQVTATVVDTDAGTKSNPAGSVSFTSGAGSDVFSPTSCTLSPLGSTTDTSTCTVNLTSTTVGTHSITATYGGSAVHAGSSGSATLTVNKANTTSVLVSSQNPSIFGQSVTFTVTVSAVAPGSGIPTGTVTFLDGATPIGTATLDASGVASISTSSLSIGTHSISTSYPGDGNFNGSTSNTVNQVVNKVPTTTTLVSSVNPSTFGQSVTFTATVTSSGSGTPTGTVTFMDGATTLGTGTLSGGVASFSTATLSVGTHSITAVYGGDSTFAGSTSNTVNQVVNKAPSATALASSVNPSVFGQSVTFTATVTSAGPAISSPGGPVSRRVTKTVDARTTAGRAVPNAFGIGTPTGTVTFFDGATPIGTGTLDGSGVATLTISTLSVGTHSITASYSGDGNFLASTSPAVSQVVNKANTTTANVTSTANPSVFGQAVTLSTTVTAVAPGAGTPTGTVTFLDGATPIGTGTLNGAGQASITLNTLAVGTHLIKATYGGSGNFNGSTSATALSQVVNKANTTTTIVASPNPAFVGGSTTYTITVAAVAPGAGTPTGTVQVKDNGVNVGGPVTLVGGSATVTENHLAPPGVHTITAVYSGDGNFNASTGTLSLVVGFRFEDHVTHNVLIVIPPANGQSGQGTWTWISNGVTIFADVPAFISINPIILSVHTISPAVMNATFNLQVGVGSAVLFDPATLHVYILNEVF